jgi:hypothetical protein
MLWNFFGMGSEQSHLILLIATSICFMERPKESFQDPKGLILLIRGEEKRKRWKRKGDDFIFGMKGERPRRRPRSWKVVAVRGTSQRTIAVVTAIVKSRVMSDSFDSLILYPFTCEYVKGWVD